MVKTNKYQVYQVLLDIGQNINGILVINPAKISEEMYHHFIKSKAIYQRNHDITLDFGVTNVSFRFAGITDSYLDIYDLVTKMIFTAVDQTSTGLMVKEEQAKAKQALINSVNQTELYLPNDMILPSGLAQMFQNSATIHRINFDLAQKGIGRLADMLKAGNYNLTHIDMYDKERDHKNHDE